MTKNWLIRTDTNKILGPTTKQKIIELIEKKQLIGNDEISSGNGYWFWIKEEDLLDRFLYGNEVQPFNPIERVEQSRGTFSQDRLPGQEDLSYPDAPDTPDAPDSPDTPSPQPQQAQETQTPAPAPPPPPAMAEEEDRDDLTRPIVPSIILQEGEEKTYKMPTAEDLEYPEMEAGAEAKPETEADSEAETEAEPKAVSPPPTPTEDEGEETKAGPEPTPPPTPTEDEEEEEEEEEAKPEPTPPSTSTENYEYDEDDDEEEEKRPKSRIVVIIVILLLLAIGGFAFMYPDKFYSLPPVQWLGELIAN